MFLNTPRPKRAVSFNHGKCQAFETVTPQCEARREISAGASQACLKVLDQATTQSAPWSAAGNAGQYKRSWMPTRRRQLLLMRFRVTSRLFSLMKQKVIFVYPFSQISNFSLT
jgi:hypothetical protein